VAIPHTKKEDKMVSGHLHDLYPVPNPGVEVSLRDSASFLSCGMMVEILVRETSHRMEITAALQDRTDFICKRI
jgi:hypothetical protein